MTDSKLHMAGIIATVTVHLGVVVGVSAMGGSRGEDDGPRLAEREVIEAGLAFKKAPDRKNRQPQKKKNPKVKPAETVGVSRDADKAPKPKKDKDRKPPPKENLDPTATLDKFRNIDIDEEPTDVGIDPDEQEDGSDDGSEWGTMADAKGHPYVGELAGRIEKAWRRPTLDTGKGAVEGCVTLSADGRIVDRQLREKSSNSTLNRSVEEALRNATSMGRPVPKDLKALLTVNGICFRFTPKNTGDQ